MTNIGPMLLINVVLVAVGIGVYHVATADDSAGSGGDFITEKTTVIHDDGSDGPMLDGGSARNDRRISELEAEIASLKELLGKRHASGGSYDASGNGGGSGDILPSLDLDVGGTEEKPTFDEDSLTAMKKYMDEIRRRDAEERLVNGLERQLGRLDVNLSEEQSEAVIKATIAAREKRMAMFREMGQRGRNLDEAGREAFREEMRQANDKLREEWSTTVYSLVPAGDAEKIVEGMGRSISWGGRGGFDTGGRAGGGRNRNR